MSRLLALPLTEMNRFYCHLLALALCSLMWPGIRSGLRVDHGHQQMVQFRMQPLLCSLISQTVTKPSLQRVQGMR